MIKKLLSIIIIIIFSIIQTKGQEFQKILPEPYLNSSNEEYGYSVAISGNYAVIGAPSYNSYQGCAYVLNYTGTEWQTIAILTASDGVGGDFFLADLFGKSVDIFDNYIVIGAEQNEYYGAAYIYEKPATGWINMTETAKLTLSNNDFSRNFGNSVSIYDNCVVIGDDGYDENGWHSGAVYVFQKPATGWSDMTETAKLLASDAGYSDYFGVSVNIFENTIVIGAEKKDLKGAAYIFEKPISGWTDMTETAKLSASDGANNDFFGNSVKISNNTVIVGAYHNATTGTQNGAVYIFEKPVTGWTDMTETAKLTASDSESYHEFGYNVDIDDNNIIVGSQGYMWPNYKNVYIFEKPVSGWINMTETAKLTSINIEGDDDFGCSVGISGNHAIVGSSGDDDNGTDCGSAYFYEKSGDYWTDANEDNKTYPTSLNNFNDNFGNAISVDGNYAVVGTENYNENIGCAYVYKLNGYTWDKVAKLTADDGEKENHFGHSVCISGNTIVIGVSDNYHALNNGYAYVFEKPASGWTDMTQTAKLTTTYSQQDLFAQSIDIFGDVIVGGATGVDDNGVQSGAVYVFEKPASGWSNMTETAKLLASDGNDWDEFGKDVSIYNNTIVVGAWKDDDNGTNSGSAYIFERPVSGWANMTETAKLLASDNDGAGSFGYGVDIYETTVVVQNGRNNSYIFEKPVSGWVNMTENAVLTVSDASYFNGDINIFNNSVVVGFPENENKGAAYLFNKPASGWTNTTESIKITPNDLELDDYFGCSVNLSNNILFVGAKKDDDNLINSGSTYIFNTNALNLSKIKKSNISIYPNPTTGIVYLDHKDINIKKLIITDITGKTIIEKSNIQQNETVDLSSFDSGIYIIKIQTDNEIFTTKIVKE